MNRKSFLQGIVISWKRHKYRCKPGSPMKLIRWLTISSDSVISCVLFCHISFSYCYIFTQFAFCQTVSINEYRIASHRGFSSYNISSDISASGASLTRPLWGYSWYRLISLARLDRTLQWRHYFTSSYLRRAGDCACANRPHFRSPLCDIGGHRLVTLLVSSKQNKKRTHSSSRQNCQT